MTGQGNGSDFCQAAARLVRTGEFAQAIELYRQELAQDERNVEAHRGLATAAFMTGDYEQAVEHFTRITRLDPRAGSTLVNLGAVYNRMGKYDKAVEVLRRGAQMEKCPEAFYNLGIAQRHLGQLAMAVSAYREAIRRAPQMVEAYQNLANVYLEMGNHQQAIAHYKKALEISPGFERARAGLESAQRAVTEARQAISPFGRLVDAHPGADAGDQERQRHRARTEQELMEYRLELRRLSVIIQEAGRAFAAHLKERVEPQLLALNRTVGEGREAQHLLGGALAEFHAAIEEWAELRRRLKSAMQELREMD
ncbi:MAG: tetratricopeptide repeat protein [Planctomycetales bacterium]